MDVNAVRSREEEEELEVAAGGDDAELAVSVTLALIEEAVTAVAVLDSTGDGLREVIVTDFKVGSSDLIGWLTGLCVLVCDSLTGFLI